MAMQRTFSTILGRKNSDALARTIGKIGSEEGNGPLAHIAAAGINSGVGAAVGGIAGAAIGIPNDNIDDSNAIAAGAIAGAGVGALGSALTSLKSTPRVVRDFDENVEGNNFFKAVAGKISEWKAKNQEGI